MKYIKKYENNNVPQNGDYVICQYKEPVPERIRKISGSVKDINNFLSNHIGRISSSSPETELLYNNMRTYIVNYNYKDVPYMLKTYGFFEVVKEYATYAKFKKNEIIYYSPNIEDIKVYLKAKNYNL